MGARQDLSGPAGNSQAFPLLWLKRKTFTHWTHPCMLKSSAGKEIKRVGGNATVSDKRNLTLGSEKFGTFSP